VMWGRDVIGHASRNLTHWRNHRVGSDPELARRFNRTGGQEGVGWMSGHVAMSAEEVDGSFLWVGARWS